jgi:hypothetical protein
MSTSIKKIKTKTKLKHNMLQCKIYYVVICCVDKLWYIYVVCKKMGSGSTWAGLAIDVDFCSWYV